MAKPSLIDLRIGIPPATEASNSKLTLFFSAILTKSFPCLEIKALFGVITWILFIKAVWTTFLDIPSAKPIASNKISILCLSKNCTVNYRCSEYRHEKSETTLKWDDKDVGINWGIKKPILSIKDKNGKCLNYFK